MLFLNESFFVVSCFVLVVGDLFLIRSVKKFFCFGYMLALACVRPGVRVCVYVRVYACAREGGCDICATLGGCGIYASLLQKRHTFEIVAKLQHFFVAD